MPRFGCVTPVATSVAFQSHTVVLREMACHSATEDRHSQMVSVAPSFRLNTLANLRLFDVPCFFFWSMWLLYQTE